MNLVRGLLFDGLPRASAPLRALAAVSATVSALALTACVAEPAPARYGPAPLGIALPSQAIPLPGPGGGGRKMAILLPLTGGNAELGASMLKAAQLALSQPGSPTLDSRDTGGTPDGAARAAREALAAGDTIILGPLTSAETAAAAAVARTASVPMLAFTSDAAVAQPGVWTLGITPAQQVRRLVSAAVADNKVRIGAVLPVGAFGDALAAGVTEATTVAGLPPARIQRTANTPAGIGTALKEVSDYAARHPAGAGGTTPDPASLPPPVDALLLGVGGPLLVPTVPLLAAADLSPGQVRVLGPATWARDAASLPGLAGAWYAAPDPATRGQFEKQYIGRYNVPPRDFSSIAFDAAAIARVSAGPAGFDAASLTRPEGFGGTDGVIVLSADGRVRRGLGLFEIGPSGPRLIQPAPQALPPGS